MREHAHQRGEIEREQRYAGQHGGLEATFGDAPQQLLGRNEQAFAIPVADDSPDRLAILGGSNGGLLVGAAMTQRPDLFAVALPAVGVLDMLRYDKFTGGALWVSEYGSPSDTAAFKYLRAYSPLHNVRAGTCYPATMVTNARGQEFPKM